MLFGFKVSRHATVDLATLAHAAPKGHALQLALQVVTPLVIGANKFFAVAVAFAHELHAAVGADVLKHLHFTLGIAHHDDRALAHGRAFEVTHLGYLDFQAHITPMLLVKKSIHLHLVQGGLGVCGKRDATGVALFPMQGLRLVGRGHGGAWFNDKPLSSLKRAPVWPGGQKFLSLPGQ